MVRRSSFANPRVMSHVESFLYSCTLTKSAAGKSLSDPSSLSVVSLRFLLFFFHSSNLNTEL
jgi:hypothetical protein